MVARLEFSSPRGRFRDERSPRCLRILNPDYVVPVLVYGRTKQGSFWAMARDDRPLDSGYPPAVAYNYVPGRRYAQPNAPLRTCRGVRRCDGYDKKLVWSRSAQPSITLAFYWRHLRRGIYCLAKMKAPVATEVKRVDAPALPRFGLSSSQTNSSRFQRLQRAAHAMTGY
jgi:hypothetical protein